MSERSRVRVPPLILKYRYMEVIYFISGVLTAGVVYGVNLLRHVKSSHTELLNKYDKSNAISSLRHSEVGEMVDEMKVYVNDIQDRLNKDSYAGNIKLTRDFKRMEKILDVEKKKLELDIKTTNDSFTKAFGEIQQLKNQLKAMGEDPNFLSRY